MMSFIKEKYNKYIYGLLPAFLIHLGLGNIYSVSQITNKIALDSRVDESYVHLVFVVMLIVMGISSALSSRILKIGLKYSIFLSILLFVTGTFMTSLGLIMNVFHPVVIGYGVISAIGLGFLYLIPIRNVMKWFPKHEGLAVGFTILGFGLSGMVSSSILSLDYYNNAYVLVLKVLLTSIIPMILGFILIRKPNPNEAYEYESFIESVKKMSILYNSRNFKLIWFMLLFKLSIGLMMMYNLFLILNYSILKFDYDSIIMIAYLVFASNCLGRIVIPLIVDNIPEGKRLYMNYAIFGIPLISLIATYLYHEWSILPVVLCVMLFMYGGGVSCIPIVLKESYIFVKGKNISMIQGMMFTSWCVAGLIGAGLGKLILENLGVVELLSYATFIYLAGLMLSIKLVHNLKLKGRYKLDTENQDIPK